MTSTHLDRRIARRVACTTGLAVLGLGLGAVVAAAEPSSPARAALKQNCIGDYMDYCSAYAPGGPEVEACFKANLKNLSPGCSAAITAYKKEQRANKRFSEAR